MVAAFKDLCLFGKPLDFGQGASLAQILQAVVPAASTLHRPSVWKQHICSFAQPLPADFSKNLMAVLFPLPSQKAELCFQYTENQ
jgi:hypothetical protein